MKAQRIAPDFQKWEKWERSLARIKKLLLALNFAREMFERLDRHFSNHNYQDSLLSIHLQNTYVCYLAMGIRRLLDRISNEQNLYQLLEDIGENACHISADNYAQYMFKKKKHEEHIDNSSDKSSNEKRVLIESYQETERKLALCAFNDALGDEAECLYCCDVTGDIKELEGIKGRVGKLADTCWAHMDKKGSLDIKFAEVHEALDSLIRIYDRYSLLTAGSRFVPYDEVFFTQWDAPLRVLCTE